MDKRILKTKKNIRTAFFNLITEKSYEKITIKEIAQRARIDRKTVYNYYKGVDVLLEELENELIANFEKDVDEFCFETVEDAMFAFSAFAKHLSEHMEEYSLLMKIDRHSILSDKIVAFLKGKIRSIIDKSNVPERKINLAVEYVTAGIISSYRYWFNSDREQSLEAFTSDLARLIIGGTPVYFLKK